MQDDEALCACPVFTSAIAFCLHKLKLGGKHGVIDARHCHHALHVVLRTSCAFRNGQQGFVCGIVLDWRNLQRSEAGKQKDVNVKFSGGSTKHQLAELWSQAMIFVEAWVVVHVQGLATCRLTSTGFSGVADRWILFSFSLGFLLDFLLIGEMIHFDKHFEPGWNHEHVCCAPFFWSRYLLLRGMQVDRCIRCWSTSWGNLPHEGPVLIDPMWCRIEFYQQNEIWDFQVYPPLVPMVDKLARLHLHHHDMWYGR